MKQQRRSMTFDRKEFRHHIHKMEDKEEIKVPKTFYELGMMVGEIRGTLNEVKGKLDSVAKNHDDRINCMEKDVATMQGKATIVGGIAGLLMGVVGMIISYFKSN